MTSYIFRLFYSQMQDCPAKCRMVGTSVTLLTTYTHLITSLVVDCSNDLCSRCSRLNCCCSIGLTWSASTRDMKSAVLLSLSMLGEELLSSGQDNCIPAFSPLQNGNRQSMIKTTIHTLLTATQLLCPYINHFLTAAQLNALRVHLKLI